MANGDVYQLLQNPSLQLSLCKRMGMAKDAALGINWLHCSDPILVHRDLKTSNLLVDQKWTVKICDFGFSQLKARGEKLKDDERTKGSPYWMAPELLCFEEFDEKVDVYAFGIILWELLTRKTPFAHIGSFSKLYEVVYVHGERPPIPEDAESSLRELIEYCWDEKPANRPSFSTIISVLSDIIVDVGMEDTLGRQFWKVNFKGRSEIPWREFAWAFDNFLDLPSDTDLSLEDKKRINLNITCLRAILVTQGAETPIVKLEKFGHLLQCFGPITDPVVTPIDRTILDKIREVMEQPWFHGDIDLRTAERRLSDQAPGVFLVRYSSIPGCFTLSQMSWYDQVVEHHRIIHAPGRPYITADGNQYASLFDLIEQKGFTKACSGSRFAELFKKEVRAPSKGRNNIYSYA
eukprot:TRINITY_DN3235_c0_g1_i2.p1 TRINITY_DN3235_c0_g1~~TRINITY_DN3235_c0_g1_i2.p1  ORF type:complete len:406 (+),score=39.10 TRINITY_DN3235_c0_g1_i2:416-1633(+)